MGVGGIVELEVGGCDNASGYHRPHEEGGVETTWHLPCSVTRNPQGPPTRAPKRQHGGRGLSSGGMVKRHVLRKAWLIPRQNATPAR